MNDKYSANVFWDNEDQCFIATCCEFPLLSAHGDTREEATAEFQFVLEMAIESYTEDNLELPKPKTTASHSGQFRIRMPKSLHRALTEMAEKENVSLNTYALSLLSENNALKKVYSDQIQTLEHIVKELTTVMISQHSKLQVHTQRIDFLEKQSLRQEQSQSEWTTTAKNTPSFTPYYVAQ